MKQALLKKVGDWCSVWGISVNSNKSAVLHFRQPTLPLTDAIFTLGVMQIPIVKRYTYLHVGIIVEEFTTYQDTVQAKIEKATGAFYAMVAQLRQIGGASHRVYKNLYVTFKSDYNETEGYVQRTRVKAHRSLLARLRGGTAPLQIEIGRYVCLLVEERKCKTYGGG